MSVRKPMKQRRLAVPSPSSSAKSDRASAGNGTPVNAVCLGASRSYEEELRHLQIELVKLQEWVRDRGLKVVVLFEGRDAAGKGGAIKRITQTLNPRVCRVVALATPSE